MFVVAVTVDAQPPDKQPSQSGNSLDGYILTWADDFERDGPPNPDYWAYEEGFVRNRELQWYQKENAICEGGVLVIEARRERKKNPRFIAGSEHWQENREFSEYTSASLMTKGLQSWQYGRFELRAKISPASGLWPVFWTLGEAGQWPASGEIDILEAYRGKLLANVAWAGDTAGNPSWNIAQRPISGLGEDWTKSFHVWRMDWNSDTISLYLDDLLMNRIELSSTSNPRGLTPENPFHQPHYLLLSLAIGGRRGGDPSQTDFPVRFEIDYVRAYRRQQNHVTDIR